MRVCLSCDVHHTSEPTATPTATPTARPTATPTATPRTTHTPTAIPTATPEGECSLPGEGERPCRCLDCDAACSSRSSETILMEDIHESLSSLLSAQNTRSTNVVIWRHLRRERGRGERGRGRREKFEWKMIAITCMRTHTHLQTSFCLPDHECILLDVVPWNDIDTCTQRGTLSSPYICRLIV